MPVIRVNSLTAAREALVDAPSPVVIVPVYNGYEDVVRCYESLFTHTPPDIALLIVDDAGPDRRPITFLDRIEPSVEHFVVVLHRDENGGFTRACNDAFRATAGRDVVVVNSDLVVGSEWLTRLTDAALSSSLIATASTLTNHGTMVSLPVRNAPSTQMPRGMTPDEAALRVAAGSLRLRPTIPTAIGHCMYIKRVVLDLLDGFDEAFGTGYAEEVDFSQRAVQLGFRHVCADDVFTYHRGGASFGLEARAQKERNEAVLNVRYPWFPHWTWRASTDRFSPLAVALDQARMALVGRSIGIDATRLGGAWAGTHSVILETIVALAELMGDARLRVFHTESISPDTRMILDGLPNVDSVSIWRDPPDPSHAPDVLYRPCQVNSLDELRWLRSHGRRVIVNQLDTIAWSNPSYFSSDEDWLQYRDLTRLVLNSVDGIAFISDFARQEVEAEGMIPSGTPTRVVHCGATSLFHQNDNSERRPEGFDDDDRPFMLVLGASYHHKNRAFALELLGELMRRGWDGRLVLAGPTPPSGNSLGIESAARLVDPSLRSRVATLGDLTELEKNWLYARAALTLYPTVSEGFGLVPFESARRGTPVLASRQGSLDEILPDHIVTLNGYDVAAAADQVCDLLGDPAAARLLCDVVKARAAEFTWKHTAAELLALVDEVVQRPPSRVAAIWGENAPVVLDEPPALDPPSVWSDRVERTIQRVLSAEKLKRAAVPVDSRRQQLARRTANWARRQSGAR